MRWDLKIPRTIIHTGMDRDRLHNPQDVSSSLLKSLINYLENLFEFQVIIFHIMSSTSLFYSREHNGHFMRNIIQVLRVVSRQCKDLIYICSENGSNIWNSVDCPHVSVRTMEQTVESKATHTRRKQKFLKLHSSLIFMADRFLPNSRRSQHNLSLRWIRRRYPILESFKLNWSCFSPRLFAFNVSSLDKNCKCCWIVFNRNAVYFSFKFYIVNYCTGTFTL